MIYKRNKKYYAIFKNRGFGSNNLLKKNYPNLDKQEKILDPIDLIYEEGYDGTITDNRTIAFEFETKNEARDFIIDCINKELVEKEFVGWYGVKPFKIIIKEDVERIITEKIGCSYVKKFTESAAVFCWIATKNNMPVYLQEDLDKFLKDPDGVYWAEEFEIRRTASCVGVYSIAEPNLSKAYGRLNPIW